MANKFLSNIWVIDTASSQVINDDVHTRVNVIRWVVDGDAADGDDLKITDATDNLIWHDIVTNSNSTTYWVSSTSFDSPLDLRSTGGIKVSTLSHGKVYFYLE